MLFGFKSGYETFHRVKKFFTPFYELWTIVSEIMVKRDNRWKVHLVILILMKLTE